jgi:hypothetical protein
MLPRTKCVQVTFLPFPMYVLDQDVYATFGDNPRRDLVSRVIDQKGIWEGFQCQLTSAVLSECAKWKPLRVIDVGGHVGTYSLLSISKQARVSYVEPMGLYRSVFSQTIGQLPQDTQDLVSIFPIALGKSNFDVGGLVQPDECLAVLKLDIEGGEPQALDALGFDIVGRSVAVFIEVSPRFTALAKYERILTKLFGAGYKCYDIGVDLCAVSNANSLATLLSDVKQYSCWEDVTVVNQTNLLFVDSSRISTFSF